MGNNTNFSFKICAADVSTIKIYDLKIANPSTKPQSTSPINKIALEKLQNNHSVKIPEGGINLTGEGLTINVGAFSELIEINKIIQLLMGNTNANNHKPDIKGELSLGHTELTKGHSLKGLVDFLKIFEPQLGTSQHSSKTSSTISSIATSFFRGAHTLLGRASRTSPKKYDPDDPQQPLLTDRSNTTRPKP